MFPGYLHFCNHISHKREAVLVKRSKVKTPRGIIPFGVFVVTNVLLNAFTESSIVAST
jgi:hypothetical protein